MLESVLCTMTKQFDIKLSQNTEIHGVLSLKEDCILKACVFGGLDPGGFHAGDLEPLSLDPGAL